MKYSSKVPEEECVLHTRSNNIKFTSYTDAKAVVDELFLSLRSRCQRILETSIRRSNFIFEIAQLMY